MLFFYLYNPENRVKQVTFLWIRTVHKSEVYVETAE